MNINTQYSGYFYSNTYSDRLVSPQEAFVMAKSSFEEAHKLTPENIKNEDDWRKMSDKEWDKLVEHIDKYLDTTREELKTLKERQIEAAQKMAAEAPAGMKAIFAAQAALEVAANGFMGKVTSADASELEKHSWTYKMETDNQTILAEAKMANERASDMLMKSQDIALEMDDAAGKPELVTTDFVATEDQTCPYSHLAKGGVIEYNGVTFMCDYKHNAISLGDVSSDPRKVLNIPLPSGGNLYVNIDNLDDLAKAAGMFSPKDLNAILRAIQTYRHCTSKLYEIEDEESKSPEEIAQTPPDQERVAAAEEMTMTNESIYQRLMSKDSISDMNSGIILDYEERLSAEELERRIEMLFEDDYLKRVENT